MPTPTLPQTPSSLLDSGGLADCHLHFEGSLPPVEIARLARRAGHAFADPVAFDAARGSIRDPKGFLDLYAEVCRLFRAPDDYVPAAIAVASSLADGGLRYAEVYVSPEIFERIGLDAAACLEAIHTGFRESLETHGILCRILLDTVRHWGPEAADRVLDVHERTRLSSVVGFGMGGDEKSFPAVAFANAYLRARALGLRTSVHAGEWAGPEAVREVLDALRPDRMDHGIAAASDPALMKRLAEEDTILCVAPTSNLRTGAVPDPSRFPLKRLLDAGVRVTLSADDPGLFGTTTAAEYRFAAKELGVTNQDLAQLAGNAWHAAFCSPTQREEGLRGLAGL